MFHWWLMLQTGFFSYIIQSLLYIPTYAYTQQDEPLLIRLMHITYDGLFNRKAYFFFPVFNA